MKKSNTTAMIFFVLCTVGMSFHLAVDAQRTAESYIEEVNQLLLDAERADIAEMEADARRQQAQQTAAKYAETVKLTNPTGIDRLRLGLLYHLANDTQKAVATFREALEDKSLIDEQKQQARIYLIQRLAEGGRIDEAESVLAGIPDSAFNADETRAVAHDVLAVANTKLGQMEKALQHEEKALEAARQSGLIPRIWLTARSLAQFYTALDRKDDAVKMLDELKAYFERQVRLSGGTASEALETAVTQIDLGRSQLALVDNTAPEISPVKWIKETPTTLAALRGQVVVLEFWAAWCPDCRAFIPDLRNWHTRYSKQGLKIVAVTRYFGYNGRETNKASPAEEESFLLKFKQSRGMPYGMALEEEQTDFEAYHVKSIPTVALIDRAGRVRMIFTWHQNGALAEYVIKKLLAEPVPPATIG